MLLMMSLVVSSIVIIEIVYIYITTN